MSSDATIPKTPPEELPDIPDEELVDPGEGPDGEQALVRKEQAIQFGLPLGEFSLPSGRILKVYAKSEGQNARINAAFRGWLDAMHLSDGRLSKPVRVRGLWWRRRFLKRQKAVDEALTLVQAAKAEFFRRIFEDLYDERQHQKMTAGEFLSMGTDIQEGILETWIQGNDVGRLLRWLIPGFEKKKKELFQEILRDGLRI